MSESNEIVDEFLSESKELLDSTENDVRLLTLDNAPPPQIASIFRTFHTIKGTSGFLGFAKINELGLAAEALVGAVRSGRLAYNGLVAEALLESVKAIRAMLANVVSTGNDGEQKWDEVLATLKKLKDG